jgi:hypothetical protein
VGIDEVTKMDNENSLLGCFVSATLNRDDDLNTVDAASEKGKLFRTYIWGTDGISDTLETLNHQDYGRDLVLILFQFYVNPIPYQLAHLKEVESYRKKEKSIGIPIIVNEDNFFSKPETERRRFLRESILQKLRLLEGVVKKKKLDTDVTKLRIDVERILPQY